MGKIVGCVEAHELTLCKQGANQHAHVLMLKRMVPGQSATSKTSPPAPRTPSQSELDMDKTAIAAMIAKTLSWTDVTKAHYAAMAEADQPAFVEKSAEDQNKIAAEAKTKADAAAAEAAKTAPPAAGTFTMADLEKALAESPAMKALREENEALKGAQAENMLKNRAMTEFAGFPGGVDAALPMLKMASAGSAEDKERIESMMKAQIALTKKTVDTRGFDATDTASSPLGKITAKAQARATEKSIPFQDAFNQIVAEEPELSREASHVSVDPANMAIAA